jgi:biotin transport system substrate-specific component
LNRIKKISTRDICFIGLFTAITSVLAQISIPMPLGVPLTMQTFAIALAGVMLGSQKSFLSALMYVLLGAVGAPVFTHFNGGLGILLGPTGGFIISFPIMAWLIGFGSDRGGVMPLILGLAAGIAVNYLAGAAMFAYVTGNGMDMAFSACVIPFIPTGIIKAALAGALGAKIRHRVSAAARALP